MCGVCMAEEEGFEPPRARKDSWRFSRPLPSAGLGYSSVCLIILSFSKNSKQKKHDYHAFYKMVDPVGLEPTTGRL